VRKQVIVPRSPGRPRAAATAPAASEATSPAAPPPEAKPETATRPPEKPARSEDSLLKNMEANPYKRGD
jgi:hypothetical protein